MRKAAEKNNVARMIAQRSCGFNKEIRKVELAEATKSIDFPPSDPKALIASSLLYITQFLITVLKEICQGDDKKKFAKPRRLRDWEECT